MNLKMFGVSYRKNGGIRFVKIGRVFFSFGLSRPAEAKKQG